MSRLSLLALLVLALPLAASTATAASPTPTPQIAGTTFDGKRMSLAGLRGKPVIVNVWSSW